MKKYLIDLTVVENIRLHADCCLLKLNSGRELPEMIPGQFVQVRVDDSQKTFLRRPFSINYLDKEARELWLLIQIKGEGTRHLSNCKPGEMLNVILPLGNGFSAPPISGIELLLIGGGIGVAPLLFWGDSLKKMGYKPAFLLGARTKDYIVQYEEFTKVGDVYVTTEDGSMGEKGFVTHHSILRKSNWGRLYACGPHPMLVAVAKFAKTSGFECEVSLENEMACGIGTCLCCVEKTVKGNVCVCTEGPVFNINQLTWQI